MITSRFPLGNVSFTDGYFSTLVGEATKQCYGVAAMAPRDMTDAVKSMVYGSDYPEMMASRRILPEIIVLTP
jgi:uncharacterized alkaline shock family protein YloU